MKSSTPFSRGSDAHSQFSRPSDLTGPRQPVKGRVRSLLQRRSWLLNHASFLTDYVKKAKARLKTKSEARAQPRAEPRSGNRAETLDLTPVQIANVEAAQEAGLIYVDAEVGGLTRQMKRGKPVYFDASGKRVRDAATIERINHLAIPPAYTDVWICPHARGHIQATGRDARGRKQYRYHEGWRNLRDANKYERMIEFVAALPEIRRHTDRHLALSDMPREKVLATVVRLLEKTLIRVGNEEYARENQSFGLTTLRNRHVAIKGAKIHFEFRGKSKVSHALDLEDRRLARIIRSCQELPGHELFQYVDDQGQRHRVASDDVNQYLQELTGQKFTAKDFRTWAGTTLAVLALREVGIFETDREAKRKLNQAIGAVARKLGNTRAICRKCYIHPAVLDAYLQKKLVVKADKTARQMEAQLSQAASENEWDEKELVRRIETAMQSLRHGQMEAELVQLIGSSDGS